MTHQILLCAGLLVALVLFVWGRWRYDVVALLVLLSLTLVGVVPADRAFAGFGHPAVISVAAVLVVSRGLQGSGVVSLIGSRLGVLGTSATVQVFAFTGAAVVLSAFMNNVGALSILLPVAIQAARRAGRSPSFLLMPLAFASLLGGMQTLIGTPANLIVSTYRADAVGSPFRLFDFAPVGCAVALAGVAFFGSVGWRLLPRREASASSASMFQVDAYVSELVVPEDGKAVGMTVRDLMHKQEADVVVIGLARGGRNDRQLTMPRPNMKLRAGDILAVEGDSEEIKSLADSLGLEVEGAAELDEEFVKSRQIALTEAVVQSDSLLAGRTPVQISLRQRYGLNLLGLARQGRRIKKRLRDESIKPGDILLFQGDAEAMPTTLATIGCLPLAARDVGLGKPRRIVLAAGLLVAAMSLMLFGVTSAAVALSACAFAMVMTKLVTLRDAYGAIEWPVIVLLGAMLPLGEALEATGTADRVATLMLDVASGVPPWLALGMLLVTCMTLSDIINNAAAAVLMAPIALRLAVGLDCSPDPFLMATAIGCSAAFLTPIGHQSNTLVMGPGGYRFGDYARLGVPMTIVMIVVVWPVILWWWPLSPAVS